MVKKKEKSLENALLEAELISEAQLEEAHKEEYQTDRPLRTILIQKGLVTEESIARALSTHLGIPYIELDHYYIDAEAIARLPEDSARKYNLIPLFLLDENLTVAMADPFDVEGLDETERVTKCTVNLSVATSTAISQAITGNYKMTHAMKEVIEEVTKEIKDVAGIAKAEEKKILSLIEDNPVVKLVNMIITQAIRDRASDIHIEPAEENLRIRYRVDGILAETLVAPKHLQAAMTSRIKVLAGMDIAEKRKPQDGHVEIKKDKMDIDMRVATFPTIWGEKIVLRILYRSGVTLGLMELGLESESLQKFQAILKQPHGLILSTGPTGSGKTTTLYAALNTINTMERNIITIEDPVEYRIPIVNQAQINPAAGLTFATGLRSILRQDPDVIMVGEIRDLETAQLSIQAALTGHLVFSSLHTNDAPATVARLIDMGVEPYLVASTLLCAIAQRLVRLLCPRCKEPYLATVKEKAYFGIDPEKEMTFYKPNGCKYCNRIGYIGRTGIFELMIPDEKVRALSTIKSATSSIRQMAIKEGMKTLRQIGLQKVTAGITDVDEVIRVTMDEEISMVGEQPK